MLNSRPSGDGQLPAGWRPIIVRRSGVRRMDLRVFPRVSPAPGSGIHVPYVPENLRDVVCAICCSMPAESMHHTVPSHRRPDGSRVGRGGELVPLCIPCHAEIHRRFPNDVLARKYSDPDALIRAARASFQKRY